MQASSTIIIHLLLSAGVATAVSLGLRPAVQEPSPKSAALEPDRLQQLEAELAAIRTSQTQLARALDDATTLGLASIPARLDLSEIEAAVERVLARTNTSALALSAAEAGLEDATDPELDKTVLFSAIFGLGADGKRLDSPARQMEWKNLAEAGLAEEALAWFEALVEEDPSNPEARVELGEVYLLQLQGVGNGPMAGVLATKADNSFGEALKIDPGHWDARFNKAVALSFWPPVFGKQSEAIQQFELLVQQQGGMTSSPGHAQTHLLLGNMYQQLGQHDQAVQAWQVGSQIYPENAALTKQLSLAMGN